MKNSFSFKTRLSLFYILTVFSWLTIAYYFYFAIQTFPPLYAFGIFFAVINPFPKILSKLLLNQEEKTEKRHYAIVGLINALLFIVSLAVSAYLIKRSALESKKKILSYEFKKITNEINSLLASTNLYSAQINSHSIVFIKKNNQDSVYIEKNDHILTQPSEKEITKELSTHYLKDTIPYQNALYIYKNNQQNLKLILKSKDSSSLKLLKIKILQGDSLFTLLIDLNKK
jgi:hypothetical protein